MPKWGSTGNVSYNSPRITKGYAMVDTGATVPLVTKKWCKAHEVDYAPVKNHPVVQAANSQPLNVVGIASFTIRLSPSSEIDLKGVTVHNV